MNLLFLDIIVILIGFVILCILELIFLCNDVNLIRDLVVIVSFFFGSDFIEFKMGLVIFF